jgi:hypothetical protein
VLAVAVCPDRRSAIKLIFRKPSISFLLNGLTDGVPCCRMLLIIIAYGPSMVMTSISGPRDRIATRSCLERTPS